MWWKRSPDTKFRVAKYKDWFTCLDQNRSGALDPTDALAYTRWFQQHFGWSDTAPQTQSVLAAWQAFWAAFEAPMDDDADGVVRIDEFVGFHHTLAQEIERTGHAPLWAVRPIEALFRAMDIDGDGSVCVEEYGLYLASIGSDADPQAAFDRLDLNADGRLDLDEVSERYAEWVVATEPGLAGNLLLTGRLPEL